MSVLKLILLFVLICLSLGSALASPNHDNGPLKFVDLTGDFDRIWNETKDLPPERRVDEFEARFEKILPGFYSAERVKDFIAPERYRAMILKGLENYPSKRDGIRRVSSEFTNLVSPARREFEGYFGPMRGYPPIYLVVSFGEFDGGTRDLADGSHLMFGADVIDQIYKSTPIKPFIEHELFHLMHHRKFPECKSVWCNLWEEGLATYVASKLNPGADDIALSLTIPQPIRPAVEAKKTEAVCAVRSLLDSDKPDDYASLFYGSKSIAGFPPRMGYYIGFLVAQDIGQHRNLKQLAALTPKQVEPLVSQSLERMASCTSAEL
jgi:hypothetical protein